MAEFMLLLHAPTTFPPQYGAEELQNMIQRYAAWSKDLSASGRLVGGHKLRDREGRVLKKQSDQTSVMDGPYAEAKEVVGGWALLQYDTLEEAIAGQKEFAELHAKHWPEVTVVATLRQISEAPPEAATA